MLGTVLAFALGFGVPALGFSAVRAWKQRNGARWPLRWEVQSH